MFWCKRLIFQNCVALWFRKAALRRVCHVSKMAFIRPFRRRCVYCSVAIPLRRSGNWSYFGVRAWFPSLCLQWLFLTASQIKMRLAWTRLWNETQCSAIIFLASHFYRLKIMFSRPEKCPKKKKKLSKNLFEIHQKYKRKTVVARYFLLSGFSFARQFQWLMAEGPFTLAGCVRWVVYTLILRRLLIFFFIFCISVLPPFDIYCVFYLNVLCSKSIPSGGILREVWWCSYAPTRKFLEGLKLNLNKLV